MRGATGRRSVGTRPPVLALAVAAVVIGAASCAAPPPGSARGVVRVVAAENFWGSIAAQIGGRHVAVTSIISNPSADPHLYESSAADAEAMAQAGVVIENGAGYDDFVGKLLGATSSPGRVVVDAQQVLGLRGADVNPHLWYDVPEIPKVAAAIAGALTRRDPSDTADFAADLRAFDASLQPLDATIAAIHDRHPGAPVAYTERVPGYLLAAAGCSVLTPPGFARAVEDGNEPSPSDTVAMDDLISQHRIAVLLDNVQTVSAVTQDVLQRARAAGIPVVEVSETMPPSAHTYQVWQQDQAAALLRALGG